MSYMDNGEDEVDYGEAEDHQNLPGGVVEEDQEEGYEDLYDDVNIGFFEEEISQKEEVTESDGAVLGVREDEVSFAHMKGLSVSSAHFATQQNEATPAKATEMQVRGVALAIVKEEGSDIGGDEGHRGAKGEEAGAKTQPQVTITLGTKPKLAMAISSLAVSIDQTRSKEEKDVAFPVIHLQANTIAKAQDESKFTRTAQTTPTLTYPPQDRGSKENGMPLPGLERVGNEEYERVGPPLKAGKSLGSDVNRVPMEIDSRGGYAGDGTVSHGGGGMRDSITAPVTVIDYTTKHNGQSYGGGNNNTMLFVGELHWWTTDVELETALSEYGVLRNLKFYEERASGKSKGFCQVEFHDGGAAYACKEGMNGRMFHGRPCVVAFANPRTILQMGNAQVEKAQTQLRAQQAQVQARRPMNDSTSNTRGTSAYQGGDNTRSYGRPPVGTGRGGHGQAMAGKASGRGRTSMGMKGQSGNGVNVGGVAPYGQGLVTPMGSHPAGIMMPQAMMGQGYDPGYGRGASGYGGYVLPGPPFTGMVQPFPTMAPGSLASVAPHVNPAFFGRNSSANGMGMMGMDDSQNAMWGNGNLNGWVGDEHDKRGREVSYDDDGADSDYDYSNELAYEKSRGAEELNRAGDADWPERRRHREREGHREQRDRSREGEKEVEWGREKAWRLRNKSRSTVEEDEEEDHRVRSREEDYGKRRRGGNER